MYNFIDFQELIQSNSLIENGDITGCSGGAITGFNMDDTAPIGDNDIEWFCNTSSANPNSISSGNDWTSGLSHPITMYSGRRYLFKYTLSETFSNDCDVYILLINNAGYEVAKIESINNISGKKFTFQYIPSVNYSKIMIVANNVGAGSFGPSVSDINIYELNTDQYCGYALPLVKDDIVQSYTNFDIDDTEHAFANLKLGLYSDGFYLYDIATLTQVVVSGDIYNVYFSWTVPQLPKGNYRFVLYEDTNNIHYISNSFRYTSNKEHTKIIKYRNTIDTLGYLYETATTFYNQFRIDLYRGKPAFPNNSTGYQTYTGDFIRVKSDIQKTIEFVMGFASETILEAFISALLHDEVYLDGVEYKKPDGENISINFSEEDLKIGTGTVNLLEVSYSKSIESC